MKISQQISLFIVLTISVIVVSILWLASILISENNLHNYKTYTSRELTNVNSLIISSQQVLINTGLSEVPAYVNATQTDLQKKLQDYSFGNTGFLLIFDKDHEVILNSSGMDDLPVQTIINNIQTSTSGDFEASELLLDDRTFIQTHSNNTEWQWTLVILTEKDEVLASYFIYQERVIQVSLIIAIVSFFLFSFMTRSFQQRIHNIVEILNQIKLGKYHVSIPSKGSGELSTIENQINEMSVQLRSHRDHLENLVEDRTLKLKDALQDAESANKAKSRFLANMSHELRTPMHSIQAFTSLALKNPDDKKLTKYLNNIRSSSIRLTTLLNDLLDISKLEAGKMISHFKNNDILDIICQSVSEVESLLDQKSITISFPESSQLVSVDYNMITQVIVNLLSNAIKFSKTNSVIQITYSIKVDDQSKNELLTLAVIDEGVGIPEEELESIFDKFVQSSKTRTNAGGTGLGLPICKEIIKLHHGRIWAESPPPGLPFGSAFYIEIPLHQNENNGNATDSQTEASVSATG